MCNRHVDDNIHAMGKHSFVFKFYVFFVNSYFASNSCSCFCVPIVSHLEVISFI